MDNVHRPAERDEISEKVHLKTYFERFKNNLAKGIFFSNFSDKLELS